MTKWLEAARQPNIGPDLTDLTDLTRRGSNDADRVCSPEVVRSVKSVKSGDALLMTCAESDLDAYEERAAIAEYDGGLSRAEAEGLAVRGQGFENVLAFRAALRKSMALK